MTSPTPEVSIALELAELRRSVDVGNATTQGQLALLVQRGDQTDRRLDDHEGRLDSLERGRWPLPAIGALTGLAGLVAGVAPLISR